jgi:hypothetical protein
MRSASAQRFRLDRGLVSENFPPPPSTIAMIFSKLNCSIASPQSDRLRLGG